MPKNRWGYDSECKLPFDVVLVDEFSMTDIFLFLHLCDAIDFSRTKLIVVGDSAQLPSVGPGNLLYDMINSFVIPTITLNQIFRYAEGGLMKVATDVRNMKPYLYDLNNGIAKFGNDYTFINANNEQSIKCAISLYQKLLTQYSSEDILVLSAFNKGDCGTIVINNSIQKIANPNYGSEKCIKSGDTTYYVRDIVIQIKNNYEAEVDMGDMKIENANPREYSVDTTFIPNGMLGKIVDIYDETIPYTNEHKTGAIIDFDGVRVKYEKSEMSMLLLGYAISIHKSQGGSAKVTITLTPSCHAYMMNSRETAALEKETELNAKADHVKELEAKVEEIPTLIAAATEEGIKKGRADADKSNAFEVRALKKDAEYQKQLLEDKNERLTEDLANARAEKVELQQKLDDAYAQMRELAAKTVESTGGVKILNGQTQQNNK